MQNWKRKRCAYSNGFANAPSLSFRQLAERERQLQNLEAENAALKGRVQEQAMQISKFLNSTSGPGSDDELEALESASPSKACVSFSLNSSLLAA